MQTGVTGPREALRGVGVGEAVEGGVGERVGERRGRGVRISNSVQSNKILKF